MSQIIDEKPRWEYNGNIFELDLMDADTVELYEKAFKKMQEDVKKMPKDGEKSAIIRAYCKALRDVFDRLLGEGASTKLVGEKDNVFTITKCYESFLEFVGEQNHALGDMLNRITARYSPNRAQRRHPQN